MFMCTVYCMVISVHFYYVLAELNVINSCMIALVITTFIKI